MSERKVLNKYYPPDFDPSKIPRMKVKRDGKFGIRLMAPFNMRCNTCGEYIYKGKKFNSRKETVEDEKYLGLYIFRFYIKCPRCIAEIAFKTDPENTDYTLEAGATRNFEALKTAERLAMKEAEEKEAEEKNNPMKVLENRTKASLQEMDMIETLEELRDLRATHNKIDVAQSVLEMNAEEAAEAARRRAEMEEEEDEQFVRSLFGKDGVRVVKRLDSDEEDNEDEGFAAPAAKKPKPSIKPTDILTADIKPMKPTPGLSSVDQFRKPIGGGGAKPSLLSGVIVRPKAAAKPPASASVTCSAATSATTVSSHNSITAVCSISEASSSTSCATAATSVGATVSAVTSTESSASLGQAATSSGASAISAPRPGLTGLANLASYSSGSDSE